MKNKLTKRISAVLAILFVLVIILLYFPAFFSSTTYEVSDLNEWFYIDNNGERKNVTLPHKLYKDENGDIIICTELPENFSSPQVLCFWTYYQSVEIYVGDTLIYHFDDSDSTSFTKAASSKWNIVAVNNGDSSGKILTLKMNTPYKDVDLRLTEVICGNLEDVHEWLESEFGLLDLLGNILIGGGLLFILAAFLIKSNAQGKQYQVLSGVILILFSIYLRTGTKTHPTYWMNDNLKSFLCFFCLLTISIPLTLNIRARILKKPAMVLWCDVLVITELVSVIAIFLLHYFGIEDIHNLMPIGLILLFISVVTGIVFAAYFCIKEKTPYLHITLTSMLLMLLIFILEYLQFYQLSTLPFDTGVLSHIGAMLVILGESFIYVKKTNNETDKQMNIASENHNLRLQMFTSQIRPHFILNTLGAIRNLVKEDSERAYDLLYDFSNYIRNNLEQKDYYKPIPFSDELNYIETYLNLEKARYNDAIKVEFDIQTIQFRVLPLTIQPFVENALKHGLLPKGCKGTLKISTEKQDKFFVVKITDDGIGFSVPSREDILNNKKSLGMKSSILRLEKEMGATITIRSSTESDRSGTVVCIKIPMKGH